MVPRAHVRGIPEFMVCGILVIMWSLGPNKGPDLTLMYARKQKLRPCENDSNFSTPSEGSPEKETPETRQTLQGQRHHGNNSARSHAHGSWRTTTLLLLILFLFLFLLLLPYSCFYCYCYCFIAVAVAIAIAGGRMICTGFPCCLGFGGGERSCCNSLASSAAFV